MNEDATEFECGRLFYLENFYKTGTINYHSLVAELFAWVRVVELFSWARYMTLAGFPQDSFSMQWVSYAGIFVLELGVSASALWELHLMKYWVNGLRQGVVLLFHSRLLLRELCG